MTNRVVAPTLTQKVAEHLRSLIHHGEIGPGDRLPAERQLAEQLGVARMSLRDAIKVLQEDGYVEVRRGAHGGTFVTELERPLERWRARMREQVGEFDEIIDFRIALETQTARLACQRRHSTDLTQMRLAIENLAPGDGLAAFRHADSQFHDALALAAGNTRLATAIHTIRGELFIPHDILQYEEPLTATQEDHQGIYEAVRDRDIERVETLIREHIERTRRQLRDVVFG